MKGKGGKWRINDEGTWDYQVSSSYLFGGVSSIEGGKIVKL